MAGLTVEQSYVLLMFIIWAIVMLVLVIAHKLFYKPMDYGVGVAPSRFEIFKSRFKK